MAVDLYRRAFARAAEILGGKEQLAKHLGIDADHLNKWSTVAGHPPVKVLRSLAQLLRDEILTNYKRGAARRKKPRP